MSKRLCVHCNAPVQPSSDGMYTACMASHPSNRKRHRLVCRPDCPHPQRPPLLVTVTASEAHAVNWRCYDDESKR